MIEAMALFSIVSVVSIFVLVVYGREAPKPIEEECSQCEGTGIRWRGTEYEDECWPCDGTGRSRR